MSYREPRVLMLSHRSATSNILARCLWFEFEDLIRQVDNVEILSPGRLNHFDTRYRIASKVAQYFPIALNPGVEALRVDREYELFFTVCSFPKDLLYVNQLKNWRKKCKTAVCWIDEMFLNEMHHIKYFHNIISQFDHVIVSCRQVVDIIKPCIGGKCEFVLPGIDALLFAPYPSVPRFIDVLSIGRRSEHTHNQLVEMAECKGWFYLHDTISSNGCKYGLTTSEPRRHRRLLADLTKRSKYFLVNSGKFDEPGATGDEEIIGARYFEGAGSGTVMVGKRPNHPEFENLFFWPDAVVDIEPASGIEKTLCELNEQPDRVRQIRKSNVVNSLLHHDWAYRWEKVLKLARLDPMPELFQRKHTLENRVTNLSEYEP